MYRANLPYMEIGELKFPDVFTSVADSDPDPSDPDLVIRGLDPDPSITKQK